MDPVVEAWYLQQIQATFPEIESWRSVVEQGFEPAPGSVLAMDDEDWPYWPISALATVGLGMAFDHLDAVRHTIETRRFFPLAHETMLRGALIGAAQALWLLGPEDRSQRLRRARTLTAYIYREQEKYLQVVRRTRGHLPEAAEDQAAHVRRRIEELAVKREALSERAAFQTTAMIVSAAEEVMLPAIVADVEMIWRGGSGAAHGLAWSVLGHDYSTPSGEPDADGMTTFTVGGGAKRIANPYLCVMELMRQAWGLRLLRGSP